MGAQAMKLGLVEGTPTREEYPDILTLKQAAAYLQSCTKTVAQLATDRVIPARKLGNEWRFSRAALLRFIDGSAST